VRFPGLFEQVPKTRRLVFAQQLNEPDSQKGRRYYMLDNGWTKSKGEETIGEPKLENKERANTKSVCVGHVRGVLLVTMVVRVEDDACFAFFLLMGLEVMNPGAEVLEDGIALIFLGVASTACNSWVISARDC
jgi:hypothetical protein